MAEPVHLAFCFGASFAPQALVAVFSALRHTSGPVAVHVLSSDLDAESAAPLRALVSRFPQATLDLVTVPPGRFDAIALTIPYISRETYFRFLLSGLLPDADRALYLDADLVVRSDPRTLFEMDLGGAALAGARDSWVAGYGDYAARVLGLGASDPVVNAGVLLFDLRALRREGLDRACLDRMAEIVPRVEYQDQDVLNIVCRGRIATFEPAWNFTMCDWDLRKRERRAARIVHFTGPAKPWKTDRAFPRPKAGRIWLDERARLEHFMATGRMPGLWFELKRAFGKGCGR